MRAPDVIAVDFETMPILPRPDYPPEPVGVSIKWGSEKSHYYAWGHPTKNNCTKAEALSDLREAWEYSAPKLFHHAKFDVAVAVERLGLPMLDWTEIHDTMFLSFLFDPHNRSGGLKELAADLLGWPPDEQDELKDWVLSRKSQLIETFPEYRNISPKTGKPINNIAPSHAGKWIFATPGDLCGKYACGDTDRTHGLFENLYPVIVEFGMLEAYNRERQILPIFMENERIGMRVDVDGLRSDIALYKDTRRDVDDWLREELQQPDLNIDSDDEFSEALAEAEIVDDDKWTFTKTGKRSVSKDNLRPDMYNDPRIASAFGYRNRLGTCLKMFMEPWCVQGCARDGYMSASWNQTRGDDYGTRTGRPSTSKPNILNISKDFEGRTDGYTHPDFLDVPKLPLVRKYILPDEDHVFLHRDFEGQELRIFAHYESGELFQQYLKDPLLDPHGFVRDRVMEITGTEFERTIVKNINFGKIYGAGIPRIMELMKCSRAEAQEFNSIHKQALPGVVVVNEEIKRIVRAGDPIRTWGGRVYYPEEPKNGRDFLYKLINYLVQGSAADCTKEAIIRWHNHPDRDPSDRFLCTVYDEINITAHRERWVKAMRVLQEAMESIEIDIPMLSAPAVGRTWGDVVKPKEDKKRGWKEPEQDFIKRVCAEELV